MDSKVSIITPSYNREQLIAETIDSVLAQTWQNWELIIVDDNSTDNTWQIVQEYKNKDPRIKCIQKPKGVKKGPTTSRNLGLDISSGEFIIYLDSDDLLSPNCLEHRIKYFGNYPDCDFLVFPQITYMDDQAKPKLINIPTEEDFLDRFLKLSPESLDVPWLNTAPIWKSTSIKKYGLKWNEELFWDDVVYHFNALIQKLDYKYIKTKPDCVYRMHNDEREGDRIHLIMQSKNFTSLLTYFINELIEKGEFNNTRKQTIFNSFFHIWTLRLIDANEIKAAKESISVISQILGIVWHKKISLNVFADLRILSKNHPDMTYYINQFFRHIGRRSYFKKYEAFYLRENYYLENYLN